MSTACTSMTVQQLADALRVMAPGYIQKPVVNQTGIEGQFDFKLDWVGVNFIDKGGITMPEALYKELGLQLQEKKIPMKIVVIDHIEKLAEN